MSYNQPSAASELPTANESASMGSAMGPGMGHCAPVYTVKVSGRPTVRCGSVAILSVLADLKPGQSVTVERCGR